MDGDIFSESVLREVPGMQMFSSDDCAHIYEGIMTFMAYREAESFTEQRPCSCNIKIATAMNCFEILPSGYRVLALFGRPPFMSA